MARINERALLWFRVLHCLAQYVLNAGQKLYDSSAGMASCFFDGRFHFDVGEQ